MAKLFCKTLGAMLSVYCSGLLLETRALALDSSITARATASPTPAVVQVPDGEIGAAAARANSRARESSQETTRLEQVSNVAEQEDSWITAIPTASPTPALVQQPASNIEAAPARGNSRTSESSAESTLIEQVTKVSRPEDSLMTAQATSSPAPALVEVPYQAIEAAPAQGTSLELESSEESTGMEQVTNVTQLSDVQPSDWAFEALRSMVERYGCLEGYPDRTYRGNRAMTRYEFAAGLNRCLDRISELIAANTDYVKKEDLARLQRLQEEFATELANLRGRVDTLEARTTTLEGQQFSTTTILSGQASMYLGDAFGENADPVNNTTFGYETYLTFITSFTGKDSLVTVLGAGNINPFNTATEFPQGRLSGPTSEANFGVLGGNGDVSLLTLSYGFQVTDNLRVNLDAYSNNRLLTAAITPFNNSFTGAVSNFGRINTMIFPIYLQTGIGVQWKVAPWLSMDFGLGSEGGSSDNPSRGLFKGGYGASGRAVIDFGRLKFSANYIHSYSLFSYLAGAGSNAANVSGVGPVVANTYAAAFFYRLTPMFELGASVAYANVRALGEGTRGDAQVLDYRLNLVFYDLVKKGNLAGIIVGTQPRLTGTSNGVLAEAIGFPTGQRHDRDTGLYMEAFFGYKLTDNIAITPGIIWLSAPNHDERNPDVVVGVVRTTFQF